MEAPIHPNTSLQGLIQYVKQEADDLVKMVLENQSNIKTQKNMASLAKVAVEAGNKGIIITLLQHGFNVNAALDIVVNSGKEDLIKLMLNQGADANEGLYFAIKANKKDVITVLLELGANINTNKRNGNTPLHTALMQKICNVELVEFLIKKGADTRVKTQNNKSALDLFQKFLDEKYDAETKKKLENIRQLLSDNQNHKIFECIMGLSDGLSGYSYQIKIFTLYAIINTKQATSHSYQYELSTEVKNLVPFDDIYLSKTQEGRTTCEFIQIKQTKKPEFNKINPSKFFSMLKPDCKVKEHIKGNDSIVKIFLKFDEIQESILKRNTSAIFIHCENTSFQDDPSSYFIRVDSDRNDRNQVLCGIKHDQWIINKNKLFLEIKYILFNIITTSPYFSIMDQKIKTTLENQIQMLVKLKNENTFKTLYDDTFTSAKTIATAGLSAINEYSTYLGKCKKGIENANDTEQVYKNFPANFELLYTCDLSLLINKAVSKINEVSKSFTIDKDLFSYFSKFDDVIIMEKIDNFVNHFSIYTDCPTSDELDEIITKEISEEIKWDIPKHITTYCLQYFNKWIISFKNGEGKVFTDRHGITLFNDLKMLIINSFNESYIEELQSPELHYRQNNEQVTQFLDKHNNCKMLQVIAQCPRIHAIDIYQTIINIKEQSTNLDHLKNIMNTSLKHVMKSDEYLKYIFDILSSQDSNDLLILECFEDFEYEKHSKIFQHFKNLANTTVRNKLIIIATKENKLSEFLKNLIKEHTSYNETISFKDLTYESQRRFLKKTVNFHNNPNSLKTQMKMENFISMSSAYKVVDECLLSTVIANRDYIKIGNEKPYFSSEYNADTYIPRYLLSMDIRILKKSKENLFFVTGISKYELITKVSVDKQYIYTWEKDKIYNKGIVLMPHSNIATSEEIYECLTNNFHHHSNHQLDDYWKHCGKCCIWLEFRGSSLYMKRKYLSEEYENVLDNIFQKYKMAIKNLEDKIVIIANDAGEGKSTMLTHLAYCMRNKSKNSWIIRVDLRYYADNNLTVSLNDNKFCVNDTTSAIELLTRMVVQVQTANNNDSLERKLLEAVLKERSSIDVILLFDGFDEISPGFKEKTCNFIKTLSKSSIKQLWVTTRVHLKEFLEKELGVQAHTLASFDEPDQKNLMCKIWKWQLNNYYNQIKRTPEECTLGIVNLLKILLNNLKGSMTNYDIEWKKIDNLSFANVKKFIQNKNTFTELSEASLKLWKMSPKTTDFLKIPLHIEMFAKNLIQRKWNFSVIQNSLLFGMYTECVKSKLEIYYTRSETRTGNQYANDQADMTQNLIKKMHQKIAVITLHSFLQPLPDLNNCSENTNFLETLARVGLVKFYGTRVEFIHRTFAEYFFSEYLATHLDHPYVQTEFLEKILLNDEYQLVRIFFDQFLSLQCQEQEIKNFQNILMPNVTKKIISQLRNKENILHIAIRGGHFQLFLLIFKNIAEKSYLKLLMKKSREGFSMLQLSILCENSAMSNIIIDSIKDIIIYYRKPIRQILETVKEHVIINKKNIKRSIFGDLVIKRDKDGHTALHLAVKYNQISVCKNIIKAAKECSILEKLILCVDSNKCSVLHCAVWRNTEIFQNIFESVEFYSNTFKKCIVLLDINGNNVLHLAAMYERVDSCRIILRSVEKYKDILKYLLTQRNSSDKTVLYYAVTRNIGLQLCKLILEKLKKFELLKDVFIENNNNEINFLTYAVQENNIALFTLIFNTVKDHEDILKYLITQQDNNGRTALYFATYERDAEIYDIILKTVKNYKQDLKRVVMLRDNHKSAVLEKDHEDIIKYLTTQDKYGRTALHIATYRQEAEICDLILKTVENCELSLKTIVMLRDYLKRTVLEMAVWSNDYLILCNIILNYVVKYEDVFRPVIMQRHDKSEWTVLQIAAINGFSEIWNIILNISETHQYILNDLIKKPDKYGNTALELARIREIKTYIINK